MPFRCARWPTATSRSASTSRRPRSRFRAARRSTPLRADRLSTVYMPGRKITMLPDEVIGRFTLAAGSPRPALSLYVETDARRHAAQAGDPAGARADCGQPSPRCDRRTIRRRRHRPAIRAGPTSCARCGDWREKLEAARGKPDMPRLDYTFLVDWDRRADGRVAIVPRPRGSPLDKLVAELMIHVNSSWGKLLHEAGAPGLYRTQQAGKVKMSTQARAAPGPWRRPLPVVELAAASLQRPGQSAPIDRRCRRATRLRTSRATPSFSPCSAISRSPTRSTPNSRAGWSTTGACAGCEQEKPGEATARVVRDNLVRFDALPLYVRVARHAGRGRSARSARRSAAVDLLAATVEVRYAGVAPR